MAKNNLSILVLTPAIDKTHSVLGFIPYWLDALAKQVQSLVIITPLYNQQTKLSNNTQVIGLNPKRRLYRRIYYLWHLIKAVPKSDVIFCHMIPGFVLFVWPIATLFRKPIVLWYAHGETSAMLKIAHRLADRIVTSSPDGFRLKSNKVCVIGQGIDIQLFRPNEKIRNKNPILLFVGRISPVKRIETLIKSIKLIRSQPILWIVGQSASRADQKYYQMIITLIRQKKLGNRVKLIGPVAYPDLPRYYQQADLFISDSQTGSLDKTVLEAMACGLPVLVSNQAFDNSVFDSRLKEMCYFKPGYDKQLAQKAQAILERRNPKLKHQLRKIIVRDHNLSNFVDNLARTFSFKKKE